MATKPRAGKKSTKPVSDRVIGTGVGLLKDPRVSAKEKREIREAAFHGLKTGELSFSQLCKISRA